VIQRGRFYWVVRKSLLLKVGTVLYRNRWQIRVYGPAVIRVPIYREGGAGGGGREEEETEE